MIEQQEITLVCENCGITFSCPKRNDDLPPPKLCDDCLLATPEQRELRRRAITRIKSCPKPKKYPNYFAFCEEVTEIQTSDGIKRIGKNFRTAKVANWLYNEDPYEKFKTDVSTGFLHFGDVGKGVWEADINAHKLRKIVSQMLGEYDTKYYFSNILHTLKGLSTQEVKFSTTKVALKNGIFDFEKRELLPLSLDYMPFYKLPVTFDKEANDIDDFLIWIKEAANPEDIPLLQEWMGYCTYPDYPYHETLWIKGNGRNGKGVYDRSIQGLVGEENCCHIDLMNLNRRFGLKDFYHKLYYSNSEPASDKPFFTENWKRLSGGDTIEAEFKGFNEKKKFVSVAKPTIIGNKFPKVADNSIAFTDRMHFVTFSKYIPLKDRIPHLEKNWLGDKKKKSALFNWALEGLYRVIENNGFTVSKSQAETALEFQRATDPANAFINEMGIFDRSLLTTRSDLYHKLAEYCDGNGLELPTKAKLTQAMQLQAPKVKDGSTRRGGKKERAWIGFAVKDLEQLEQLEHQLQPPKNKQVSLKKREENGVPNAPSVPLKNCGNCAFFRMPRCESEAWESRNGNSQPLTNYCFRPRRELENE